MPVKEALIKSKFVVASTPAGHKLREATQNVRKIKEFWIATTLRVSR